MWTALWAAVPFIIELTLKLMFIGWILLRNRPNPPVTLTWIIIILVFPIIGFIAYLLVGQARLGRSRIRRNKEIVDRIHATVHLPSGLRRVLRPELPARYRQIAALGETVSQNAPLGGNSLQLISDSDVFIQSMIEDIDEATLHCHLLFYIYLADHSGERLGRALMRAAKRGVKCRLLVDAVGSSQFLRSPLRREMASAGVHIVDALPANVLRMAFSRVDLRNHRKIAVIDGVVGYTGSHNIACADFAPKRKFAPWVDVSVRIAGPAARDLQVLFIEDWYLDTDESLEATLEIVPPIAEDGVPVQIMGTGPNAYNEALRQLLQSALHNAQEEVLLTTPYFVPDEATTTGLCTSARRGVETTLIVPARNDSPLVHVASRSYYEILLDAGVRLYEYEAGLLHSKTMTLDRDLALVSTANLDRRSFELNFEVSVLVYDSDFASQLRFLQSSYLDSSRMVNAAAWRARPWHNRLWQNAVGVLSPVL
ncbi:MAG TPA: cardiolipin synthase [Phycisphaerales bacterium]|nr:cardiolipin synthase [Phycisphaerales bacterium]HRQ74494.1 cardiolipin synthase [Phycisphaerales bacterium]